MTEIIVADPASKLIQKENDILKARLEKLQNSSSSMNEQSTNNLMVKIGSMKEQNQELKGSLLIF